MDSINKEIELVDKFQNILDNKNNEINKDIFLTYDDIIRNDNLSKYIAVKSNNGIISNFKILNEDDFTNSNINDFEENSIFNFSKIFSIKNNPINNYKKHQISPIFYEGNKQNKDIMNINYNKSLNLIKNQNPFELDFISSKRINTIFEKNTNYFKKEIENDDKESYFNYAETSAGDDRTILEKDSNPCLEILIILFVLMVVLVFL